MYDQYSEEQNCVNDNEKLSIISTDVTIRLVSFYNANLL